MKKILGTSDAWTTSHLSQPTSKPAYYIVDCMILNRVKNALPEFFFVQCVLNYSKRRINFEIYLKGSTYLTYKQEDFQSQRLQHNEWQVTSKVIFIYFLNQYVTVSRLKSWNCSIFILQQQIRDYEAALSGLAEPKNLIDNYFAWLLTKVFCYLVEKNFSCREA